MIKSKDGEERAAHILMPNRNILQRSIVHLYPLECHEKESNKELNDDSPIDKITTINETIQNKEIIQDNTNEIMKANRPQRKAAQEARDKIFGQNLPDD